MGKPREIESVGEVAKVGNFFSESVAELKRVYHPTRQEVVTNTIRVFILIGFFGVFLGLADFLVGSLVRYIISF
jgi:preprotein translocase subunit SecE